MNLDAYRDAVIEDARRHAAATIDQGTREANDQLEKVRQEALETLDEARRAGEAGADAELRRERMRVGREARTRVLTAQREALEQLRHEVVRTLREEADANGRTELPARFAEIAREQLGEDAQVAASRDGGVVAELGRARVDYSLEAVVDRCIEVLGDELADLWR